MLARNSAQENCKCLKFLARILEPLLERASTRLAGPDRCTAIIKIFAMLEPGVTTAEMSATKILASPRKTTSVASSLVSRKRSPKPRNSPSQNSDYNTLQPTSEALRELRDRRREVEDTSRHKTGTTTHLAR